MLNLFKNRWERMLTKKAIIIIAVVIVPLMIGVAIFFSGEPVIKETIALVTDKGNTQNIPNDPTFRVVVVHKKPKFSDLVTGKYTAVVEKKNNSYSVTTLKSEEDKKVIEQFFETGRLPDNYQGEDELRAERGAGTNILGFIVMLILMQGVALTALYPEDRMLKTFRRILTSPVSEKKYLLVQSIFTFLCLYIPSYLAIVITKVSFGVEIGFGFGMLALLLAILTVLATAFSLFMASVMEQNTSLVTSGISVVTSVLGGCFISFTPNNKMLDVICSILPQKAFMTLVHGLEMGQNMWDFNNQLIYLLIWSAALWLLGGFITKSRTNKGIY
ncbi:ABC transporter permease [Bacillus atrophaeus]|uniref:ABC transporter permease n=1 Tax=Bacillus atrophaeus TaxID=1452 RepID=UPI00227E4AAB|nr:ABC transporter permease [Bacillus atrophaeus]MCY8825536.1 ABC transporter permease [Bacillus atrophaeus]MCY8839907.1 ABC transporter permease [Bacillus atrophaeus]MCY9205050.1 ABC transporter permease [Bacillus atrophaeus]MEC0767979.1 ABC transporter permease [Bacillus atrophaeus]MEC0780568.1 ABC transporter permease [Bacillus atrophaeus]